jgi:hypothetical protein
MERIKYCIVYELVNSTSWTIPLWWGYRVFLAVEASISLFPDENSATAILFKVKDREFVGRKKDIYNLHKDILQHSIFRPHRDTVWNLNGQGLSLNPKFDFDVPARVRVVLERSRLHIKHDPIFHRTSAFA